MASDQVAYELLQQTMARQRVTVYDLYGLLGVTPNVEQDGLRAAFESISKSQQAPGNVIRVAYSVLSNPAKRAQYDRDRLEYLYKQFRDHEAFPPTASIPAANIKGRDDQIQVYSATLVERVKDPVEDKRNKIRDRIETIHNELDEFNEASGGQRQDWATSNNRLFRMAGSALCNVVVAAEEDLRMLEDELGRMDGKLSPKDPSGPPGRVSSMGNYGSDIMSMPTGTVTGAMMAAHDGRPRALLHGDVPSIPRSPTVRFLPESASKMGVDRMDKDTPSSDGSGSHEGRQADGRDRVDTLFHGGAAPSRPRAYKPHRWGSQAQPVTYTAYPGEASLLDQVRQSAGGPARGGAVGYTSTASPAQAGRQPMGLIDWQRLNSSLDLDHSSPGDGGAAGPARRVQSHSPTRAAGHGAYAAAAAAAAAYKNTYDPGHSQSASQAEAAAAGAHPTPLRGDAWRRSWGQPAGTPRAAAAATSAAFEDGSYGFSVARPAPRSGGAAAGGGGGGSSNINNKMLLREVQDRAGPSAAARAPGRWVVGGAGLTNYHAGRGGASARGRDSGRDRDGDKVRVGRGRGGDDPFV